MSSMMPPMGGAPSRDSIMNPADAARQGATGQMGPNMTIREFFMKQGLDVDKNTVADLAQWVQSQAKNRTMAGKLGAQPGAAPQGAPAPGGQPPVGGPPSPSPGGMSPGGMQGLTQKIR